MNWYDQLKPSVLAGFGIGLTAGNLAFLLWGLAQGRYLLAAVSAIGVVGGALSIYSGYRLEKIRQLKHFRDDTGGLCG